MATKHPFSTAERFAVWEVYDGQCFWCGEPIDFAHTTIDHVIPEVYEEKPEELAKIRNLYLLEDSFEINSFCNWVPAHGNCNATKGIQLFKPSPVMVACLNDVAKRSKKAKSTCEKVLADKKKGKILAKLDVAIGNGVITKADIHELFGEIEPMPAVGTAELPVLMHVTDQWQVLRVEGNILVLTDGSRVGTTSADDEPDMSWFCPNCKHYGPWNGVICLTCGTRNQSD